MQLGLIQIVILRLIQEFLISFVDKVSDNAKDVELKISQY